jgi:alpha-L-rhamnosidase
MKSMTKLLLASLLILSCKTEKKKETKSPQEPKTVVLEEFIYAQDQAPTPECHASTIAESHGVLVASWFGGTKEKNKDVGIWVSRKTDGAWSTPIEVVNGIQEDGSRHPCWNPVLFKPKDGPLYLYYKVGPNPREWWGLYVTSTDDGKSWSEPVALPEGILGPIKNQPIQLADGTILSPSSTESKTEGWKIHVERLDQGSSEWTKTESLNDAAEFGAIQPAILDYGNGKLQMLSRTKNEVVTENWSEDNGKTWGPMTAMELPNPNSGIDAMSLANGTQILIYNPTNKNWGDRVPLSVGTSTDGKSWKRVLDLEPLTDTTDREGEEYSYPTVIQSSDGMVHVVYTYNRNTVKHVVINPKHL